MGCVRAEEIVEEFPVVNIDSPALDAVRVLWWSLALGGDLGGNLTAVGSSANIVMLGIAMRSGHPISSANSPARAW